MRKIAIILFLVSITVSAFAAEVTPTSQPAKWAVWIDGVVEHIGETAVGETTITERQIVSGEGDNSFLLALSAYAADFPSLPESGKVEAGDIYNHNDKLVIVRQTHTLTAFEPSDVPALFSVYREDSDNLDWIAGEKVLVGTIRIYEGTEYQCHQAHTTQSDWTPPKTPALWAEIVEQSAEWAAGVKYNVDDVVSYKGAEYYCIQAHTALTGWEPPNVPALWGVVK